MRAKSIAGRAHRVRVDAMDADILRLLREDSRRSYREIAQTLGSTTPTVAARVRAMEDIGLITGYHAAIMDAPAGARAHIVTLEVAPAQAASTAARLSEVEGARWVHLLAGGRIVALMHLHPPAGLAELHEQLAHLPGIVRYEAQETLQTLRGPPVVLADDVAVPCHQCKGPIHGDPIRARLAQRLHVFCCKGCATTFRARYDALH